MDCRQRYRKHAIKTKTISIKCGSIDGIKVAAVSGITINVHTGTISMCHSLCSLVMKVYPDTAKTRRKYEY